MNKINEYKFEQAVNPNSETPQLIQAMSSETGNFVAIKYFSTLITQKLKPEVIYRTFAMFNKLRHKHIIHYLECLHIEGSVYLVMDWCEGKSLLDTLKGYKALPEKLVARYIYEVLQALEYLHSQGNTHDNLKASNILTTNGQTKLTDFGLSAKISNLDVLNHPYWSAPEVLESKTFTKESDIWSLGCTIIELMTGKPPFADLPPEEARNHILTETMPLPPNASTHLADFLRICFNRDPSQRPSAKELQSYFWITTNNVIVKEDEIKETPSLISGIQLSNNLLQDKKAISIEDNLAAIDKIFDDSENSSSLSNKQSEKKSPTSLLQLAPVTNNLKKLPSDISDSDDFFGSSTSSSKHSKSSKSSKTDKKKKNNNKAPLLQLNPQNDKPKVNPPLLQLPSSNNKSPKVQPPLLKLNNQNSDNLSPEIPKSPKPPLPPNKPTSGLPPQKHLKPLLLLPGKAGDDSSFDIDDGSSEDSGSFHLGPPQNKPLISLPNAGDGKGLTILPGSPNLAAIDSFDLSSTSESMDFNNISKPKTPTPDNLLVQFAEDSSSGDIGSSLTENDFSNGAGELVIKQEVRKIANFDFLDESDESEKRIFAHRSKIEELSRELVLKLHALNSFRKDKHHLNSYLDRISEILKEEPSVRANLVSQQGVLPIIIELTNLHDKQCTYKILSIIYDMCVDQNQIKENFCLLGGIPPLMDFIKPEEDFNCRERAVNILTEICSKSQDNTQMFIACNGVTAIKQILSYNLDEEWKLVVSAVETMSEIFASQRATQKADLCRIFMKAGVFKPMSEILYHYSVSKKFKDNQATHKVVTILCDLFNTFSQADTKVKKKMSKTDVMGNIIKCMYTAEDGVRFDTISLDNTLTLCKTIKFIGMDPETRENLTNSGVMGMICEMLKVDFGKVNEKSNEIKEQASREKISNLSSSDDDDDFILQPVGNGIDFNKDKNVINLLIHSNLIMLLDDMCKLSQVSTGRIATVADSRLLPHLVEFLKTESELKTMTLSVIMELYNVGKSDLNAMKKLIDDNLIGIYIEYIKHQYWGSKAITAISTLLQVDELNIENIIIQPDALENFRLGIKVVDQENAPTLIKGFTSITKKSKKFVDNLVNSEFVIILINKFNFKSDVKAISQVPAALLELVLAMFQSGAPNVTKNLKTQEIRSIINSFKNTTIVRQKTFAQQILEFFN